MLSTPVECPGILPPIKNIKMDKLKNHGSLLAMSCAEGLECEWPKAWGRGWVAWRWPALLGAVSRWEVMLKKSGQGSAGQGRGWSGLIRFAFLSTVQTVEEHGEKCQGWLLGQQAVNYVGTAGAETMHEGGNEGGPSQDFWCQSGLKDRIHLLWFK